MIGCWMNMHSVLVSASTLGITLPGKIRESVFSLIIKSSTSSSSSSSSSVGLSVHVRNHLAG